ncbi:unnamed protein product [Linum trigynum]|uniref:GATA transcription factor n=1 Tax=Linum trigynum TaxID=586398 RepID=A0AAV2DK32_9ROSI
MVGPTPSSLNFMDELDCGSFFDQIDDLIDFPADDIDAVFTSCPDDNDGRPISAATTDVDESFPPPSVWAAHPGSASDLSAELSVPYEDIVQLEWLSTFVEDSFSGGSLTMNKNERSLLDKDFSMSSASTTLSQQQQFEMSSPVSVLESSSSCSGEQKQAAPPLSPEANVGAGGRCGRARSKRPRPATFTPRPAMQQLIISPTSSVTETTTPMCPVNPLKLAHDSDSHAESRLLIKIPKHLIKSEHKNKKKKLKKAEAAAVPPPPPALGLEEQNNESGPQQQQQGVRKCMHCEVTKTPQWRAGPMGPKTLCNACGVRFKSGRLFPEYRPAASPTFIPALHSNSHKKVVEMRTKTPVEMFGMAAGDTSMVPDSPEVLIPNHSNPAMDYM